MLRELREEVARVDQFIQALAKQAFALQCAQPLSHSNDLNLQGNCNNFTKRGNLTAQIAQLLP
jgi:hypothetical protein